MELLGDLESNITLTQIIKTIVTVFVAITSLIAWMTETKRKAAKERKETISSLQSLKETINSIPLMKANQELVRILQLDCDLLELKCKKRTQYLPERLEMQAEAILLMRRLYARAMLDKSPQIDELASIVESQLEIIKDVAICSLGKSGPLAEHVEEFSRCQESKIEIAESLS